MASNCDYQKMNFNIIMQMFLRPNLIVRYLLILLFELENGCVFAMNYCMCECVGSLSVWCWCRWAMTDLCLVTWVLGDGGPLRWDTSVAGAWEPQNTLHSTCIHTYLWPHTQTPLISHMCNQTGLEKGTYTKTFLSVICSHCPVPQALLFPSQVRWFL